MLVPKKGFEELGVRSFEATYRGKIAQGFVVKKNGKFFAYQNLCKHLPVTLDLEDDKFFTHDKAHLQCHMHGAMFELDSGFCVAGPCQGASLNPLELKEEDTRLVIKIPEALFEE